MTTDDHLERTTLLLFAVMVFFTMAVFAAAKLFPDDGQVFQIMAGVLTGAATAFFSRVKPPKPPGAPDDPSAANGAPAPTNGQ